jgi:hypothetical protein
MTSKCKVLLHLGNSIAFSVDNKLRLTYDFTHRRTYAVSGFVPSPVSPVARIHGFCPQERVGF